jgi:hypothetical protein
MKKDILFPKVEGVYIAILPDSSQADDLWKVVLINDNTFNLESVNISSKGYGKVNDESIETSVLRHFFEVIEAKSHVEVEKISPDVFHINNEYWVSYFVGKQMFDKKYIFLPETIHDKHFTPLPLLQTEGVLHP